MRSYSLTHLSDTALDCEVPRMASNERVATAMFLAHLAEFDARRRYAPAGYPSLLAYCVECLHLSNDAALKRIQAARVARRFPAIFGALAEGRLHLSGVVMLAPYLIHGNAGELLRAASHRTKGEIEELLAERFPRTELLALVQAGPDARHAPGHVGTSAPGCDGAGAVEHAPGHVAPGGDQVGRGSKAKLVPHAAGRFRLELTISRETCGKLRHAQALLSHAISSGDLGEVLDWLLDAGIRQLEKQKFAATDHPRPRRPRRETSPRHVPAHVKRAVWQRDGGRCTFVGGNGHRCTARRFLEFDHITPAARGGRATVDGIRLRCRAHNQFEAERAFGVDFMAGKREAARHAAARRREGGLRQAGPAEQREGAPRSAMPARSRASTARAAESPGAARGHANATRDHSGDLASCLRTLGFRAAQVRQAVEHCAQRPQAALEDQVRTALAWLCPRRGATATEHVGSRGGGVGLSAGTAVSA